MASLCEGGNESSDSLKAISKTAVSSTAAQEDKLHSLRIIRSGSSTSYRDGWKHNNLSCNTDPILHDQPIKDKTMDTTEYFVYNHRIPQ
ncbi:hypothetical protein ANN_15493 [Periplaneta americana]|uniref:Uncharacterized protein n=1 Tax=Periplaneta americana TaxID=6978 RepID=A0ABQ8SHI4_PERAM|nr:hypothetical protein ANN_15493 [Periplaneta americana]